MAGLSVLLALAFTAESMAWLDSVTPSGSTYHASGGTVTFTVVLSYSSYQSQVTFQMTAPSGFTFGTYSGPYTSYKPTTGTTGLFQIVYGSSVPSSPISFSFTVNYPGGLAGDKVFTGLQASFSSSGSFTQPNITLTPYYAAPVIQSVTVNPAGGQVNAGTAVVFTVNATGSPNPTYQWRKGGADISGATAGTHTIQSAQVADAGSYSVVATNPYGSVSGPPGGITLVVLEPPSITLQPAAQLANAGDTVVIGVTAAGTAPLTYEWYKGVAKLADGGRISGSATSTLTLNAVTFSDAGSYTVKVINTAGTVTSSVAKVMVVPPGVAASHGCAGYAPGLTATVSFSITHDGTANSLGLELLLPAGWSYLSGTNEPDMKPSPGDTNTLGWNFMTVPASPVAFSCTLDVPLAQTGDVPIAGMATMGFTTGTLVTFLVKPDPLVISRFKQHRADTNFDWTIGISELTRIIQLYNTRNGTVRTGCYGILAGTVDGFGQDPGRLLNDTVALQLYHSADHDNNGRMDVSDLTRMIQLYNTREGTTRTGAYHVHRQGDPYSVDGYAPGP